MIPNLIKAKSHLFMSVGLVSNVLAWSLLFLGLSSCESTLSVSPPVNLQKADEVSLADLEKLAHQQVNQYRQKRGLPPLILDPRISEQARIHSQDMAKGKVPFSHDGFDQRVKTIGIYITYSKAAENVAYNQGYGDPATVAVDGWIKSPGHQKNMVGDFNLAGMGVAVNNKGEYYFTQIFILTR